MGERPICCVKTFKDEMIMISTDDASHMVNGDSQEEIHPMIMTIKKKKKKKSLSR